MLGREGRSSHPSAYPTVIWLSPSGDLRGQSPFKEETKMGHSTSLTLPCNSLCLYLLAALGFSKESLK